jgi:hypothetical protein
MRLTKRKRDRLASSIDDLFRAAHQVVPDFFSAAIPPSRAAVEAAAPLLIQIEALLRSDQPLQPEGAAHLKRVITDGSGPLYIVGREEELVRECEQIIEELRSGQTAG